MMRKLGVLIAALGAALLVAGGAGAGSQPPKIDLSSMTAIDSLLQANGIDPATVVKQVGPYNYAGPSCPGAGWNCTTSTKVVQISTEGSEQSQQGHNEFVCNPTADQTTGTNRATNTCVIVQGGQNNHATCNEGASTDTTAMTCDITQSGQQNTVEVNQQIVQNGGPTQEAEQTVTIHQDASEKNIAQIHQDVGQKTSTGDPQLQDAYQQVNVTQSADGSQNYVHVHQAQDQNESGSAATQQQNVTPNAAFNCGDEKPGSPNQCVNVAQYATSGGSNVNHLNQQVGEQQTSSALTPNQTQGNVQGGQEGNVHQENPPDVGENLNFPNQDLRQRQSSPGGVAHQVQVTDPGCCGVGTQIGGAKTIEDIDQSTTQSADEPTASQASQFFGQSHQLSGGEAAAAATATTSTPQNQCSITQHGRNNGGGSTFTASGNSQPQCASLILATTCVYPSEGQSCFPADVCVECSFSPLAPTSGQAIAMPDYTSEPATYFPPTP